MKRLFFIALCALNLILIGCANNATQENQLETIVEEIDTTIHMEVFGVSMSLDSITFCQAFGEIFHDTIENNRRWSKPILADERIINVYNLPFLINCEYSQNGIAKLTLTSPNVSIDDLDPEGVQFVNAIYDSLISTYGMPNNRCYPAFNGRGSGCADWELESGWIRYTWTGCCAIRTCIIEFVDRENYRLKILDATDKKNIIEDTCALGHFFSLHEKQVLELEQGLFPFSYENDLIVVPEYYGYKYLQEKFGKGSYYRARVKNSQYPKLDFPKDKSLEYNQNKGELELFTADSSSVIVRAWQLPDSIGYLYYVAHQDYYIDMLPTWTILIYSPTSLSNKFIHKNYVVENFWPTNMRY